MKTAKNQHGKYTIAIQTDHGVRRISSGCTSLDELKEVTKRARVKELELAGKAAKLTSKVVSQIVAGKKVTVNESLMQWREWMGNCGKSARWIDTACHYISAWIEAQGTGGMFPGMVTEKHIDQWVNDDGDAKRSTRMVKLSALRSFFDFCSGRYATPNPAANVRIKMNLLTHDQKEQTKREVFTDGDITKLLGHIEKKLSDVDQIITKSSIPLIRFERKRAVLLFWIAAVTIGRHAGLRLGDICQLEWTCFGKGTLKVWTDKTDTPVDLVVGREIQEVIARIPIMDNSYCFPDQRKLHLSSNRAYHSVQFKRLLVESGIQDLTGKTFHSLRHTYATECRKAGIPMPHIRERMGHWSERMTEHYVNH